MLIELPSRRSFVEVFGQNPLPTAGFATSGDRDYRSSQINSILNSLLLQKITKFVHKKAYSTLWYFYAKKFVYYGRKVKFDKISAPKYVKLINFTQN